MHFRFLVFLKLGYEKTIVNSVWNHLNFYKLVLVREARFLVFKKLL
jgi:fumarate reductase subunit C